VQLARPSFSTWGEREATMSKSKFQATVSLNNKLN